MSSPKKNQSWKSIKNSKRVSHEKLVISMKSMKSVITMKISDNNEKLVMSMSKPKELVVKSMSNPKGAIHE